MAAWQCDLVLLPGAVLAALPNGRRSRVSEATFDATQWFKDAPPSEEAIAELAAVLPEGRGYWGPDMRQFGDSDASCVTLMYEGDVLEEVLARIDLRERDCKVADALVAFAEACGGEWFSGDEAWFANEEPEYRAVGPGREGLLSHLRSSRAATFVGNPQQWLDDLVKRSGVK